MRSPADKRTVLVGAKTWKRAKRGRAAIYGRATQVAKAAGIKRDARVGRTLMSDALALLMADG